MTNASHMSRNNFVKGAVAILGTVMGLVIGIPAIGYVLSPALKTSSSDTWIPLGPLENYPVGVPTLFNFTRTKTNGWEKTINSYGVYVFRKTEIETLTLSNICTHLSCRVNWKDEAKEYLCPCHDAAFNAEGLVISGPPPRPLDRYENKVENEELFLHFIQG